MTDSQIPTPKTRVPPSSFWQELKSRKVMRVAITYALVAWIIIQVAAATFSGFGIPGWAFRFVVIMLLLGFPVALIITWAFELTPEGIKSTKAARFERGDVPVSPQQQSRRNWLSFAFAAGLPTVIFGSLAIFFFLRGGEPERASGDKSIAVLPFTAFSAEQEEQFFADGLSDTLLHKLAQLSDIRVISRSSSFQYRGDAVDVRQVGEDLNVATLLEGSVQRSGDRLRIIAQLINTADGGHIWSKTFDRSSQDTFAIQDEIADAVVKTLQVETTPEERTRLAQTGTSSVLAYELLTELKERLSGTAGFENDPAEFIAEVDRLMAATDRVLEIDPNYAEVYRFRAELHQFLVFVAGGRVDVDFHLRSGYAAVRQAMALEPENPSNFVAYADIARRDGDDVSAEMFSRLAYHHLPNNTAAISTLALSLMGQSKDPEEALQLVLKEKELDPNADNFNWRRKVFALTSLGRTEEAIEIILEETRTPKHRQRAANDLKELLSTHLGRHTEAMRELIRIRNQIGDDATEFFNYAWLYLLGDVGAESEVSKWTQKPTYALQAQILLLSLQGEQRAAMDLIKKKAPWLQPQLIAGYIALGEFEAAIESILSNSGSLDSRNGKRPYLNESKHLHLGLRLAVCYQKIGETEAAERLVSAMDKYVESRTYNGYFRDNGYQLCLLALLKGEKANALEHLRKQVYLGEYDFVPLSFGQTFGSPIFEPLHGDEAFATIVAEYERRRAASADRITKMIKEAGY